MMMMMMMMMIVIIIIIIMIMIIIIGPRYEILSLPWYMLRTNGILES